MMKIAIIDDDLSFMDTLKMDLLKYFDTLDEDIEIECFYDPAQMTYDYAMYFVDIDLKGYNGIGIANMIRENDRNSYIIFVSARSDLVFTSLTVRPFHFIRKSNYNVDLQIFFNLLDDELKYNVLIPLRYKSRRTQVVLKDITYIESREHQIMYHTKEHIYEDSRPLKEVLAHLPDKIFIQVHKSYIININFLHSFRKDVITMNDGTLITIGTSYKKRFREFYREFITR